MFPNVNFSYWGVKVLAQSLLAQREAFYSRY